MADLRPASRAVPLSVQIAEQLRAQIETGEWPVGSRIPGEHTLTTAFDASRNTVREAVRALVHAGLLEARPGDGTYVAAASELNGALSRASSKYVGHVFAVREALEVQAARLAADRIDDDALERLGQLLASRDRSSDPTARLEADLAFHDAVVAASGNPLLAEIYHALDREATYGVVDRDGGSAIAVWGPDDEHHELLLALRRHDPHGAADAASRVLQHAREEHFTRRTSNAADSG